MNWRQEPHWLSGLFADAEVEAVLSAEKTLGHMLAVERAYVWARAAVGDVTEQAAQEAATAIDRYECDMAALVAGTAVDGVVVPALVRDLRDGLSGPAREVLHTGLTSQDVVDTAMVLTLRAVCGVFERRLGNVDEQLVNVAQEFGSNMMMGRTRMQAAQPILASHRVENWRASLLDSRARVSVAKSELGKLQLGGAVGDRAALGAHADTIAAHMGKTLNLRHTPASWHTARGTVVNFGSSLSVVSGALGKIGQDIALMAQQGVDDIGLMGGGGSSAMPHKSNPVAAELLVTLARFNATQVAGLHQAMVHEQERSGAAWMLEWMILPQMVLTTGRGLLAADRLLSQVKRIGHASTHT